MSLSSTIISSLAIRIAFLIALNVVGPTFIRFINTISLTVTKHKTLFRTRTCSRCSPQRQQIFKNFLGIYKICICESLTVKSSLAANVENWQSKDVRHWRFIKTACLREQSELVHYYEFEKVFIAFFWSFTIMVSQIRETKFS